MNVETQTRNKRVRNFAFRLIAQTILREAIHLVLNCF